MKRLGVREDDWRKDVGEKATRIWNQWKLVVVDGSEFPCYHLTLRLIALVQVSSCAVERVFPQLQVVRDQCGENMMDDIHKVRMLA